jgi:hypothetical protein
VDTFELSKKHLKKYRKKWLVYRPSGGISPPGGQTFPHYPLAACSGAAHSSYMNFPKNQPEAAQAFDNRRLKEYGSISGF